MLIFVLFFLVLLLYSVFSYSLVDPNLVLTSNNIYWSFQQWMWSTFFSNGKLMAYIYLGLIISLYIIYFHILERFKKQKIIFKNKYILLFIILIFPILLSYNSLSHDVFNYIFYVRMIVKYGVDSTTHIALDFPNDLWTRFMHNTNVVDVYGRGWTFSAIIPYLFGFGKFTLTLISFRIWSFLSMILLYLSIQFLSKVLYFRTMNLYELALVFLNPLLLIEAISNYHNDLLMMPFAIFALGFLVKPITHKITDTKLKVKYFILSLLMLAISISIKFATLALLPIWILVIIFYIFSWNLSKIIEQKSKIRILRKVFSEFVFLISSKLVTYFPDLAALIMMLLLLTPRSKYFLPWYMIWVIVWIPFVKIKLFRNFIIVLTISSSLRYLPWLFNNLEYSSEVIMNEKLITWMIPIIYLFTNLKNIKKDDFKKESLKKIEFLK